MPKDSYLDSLADVVEVLPNDASYNIESLLRRSYICMKVVLTS